MDKLNFEATDVKSIDAPLYEFYSNAKTEVADLYDKLSKNSDDYASRIKLEKIMSSAKLMGGFTSKYAQWQKDYQEGIKTGKYSEYLNKNYPEKINEQLLQGQYKVLLDKNGDLQLMVQLPNGQSDKNYANINVAEFLRGNTNYNPKERASKYATQDAIASRFGTVSTKDDGKGYTKTEYSGFDPNKEGDLLREVNNILGADAATMTDKAKSILADELRMNPDDMTDDQFNQFKQEFAGDIINKFKTETSNTIDYAAKQGQERIGIARAGQNLDERRFAHQVNEDRLDREDKNAIASGAVDKHGKPIAAGTNFVTLSVDGSGKPVINKEKEGYSYGIPPDNQPVVGQFTLRNLILDPKTNEVILKAAKPDVKREYDPQTGKNIESKYNKIYYIRDAEDKANFIKQLDNPITKKKFVDEQELSAYMRAYYKGRMNPKATTTTSPTDEIEGDPSEL
jgi:hypothetical protein